MSVTTEEAHKLWRALFDANWHKAAGALRSLAAERDALKAENARLWAALKKIGSCQSYHPEDVVAIARAALGEKE